MTKKAWQDWVEDIFAFHTKRAPGIPIGACMVDYALELLGSINGTLNAVCETDWCLCDPIQVMTGCTFGNRYLRIEDDLGRYALTLYDRDSGDGIRVFVDVEKIDSQKTPELFKFFHRTRGSEVENGGPARKASNRKVIEEFMTMKREILTAEPVKVLKTGKDPIPPARICESCGESFLGTIQTTCKMCRGASYYVRKEKTP